MAGPVYRSSLLMLAAALLHSPTDEKNAQTLSSRGCAAAHGARAVMYRRVEIKWLGLGLTELVAGVRISEHA